MMSAQNVQRKAKEKRSCTLSSLLRQRKYKTDSSKKNDWNPRSAYFSLQRTESKPVK